MNPNYRLFFELEREPFASDIEKEHILVTDSLSGVNERIHYAMRSGAVALVSSPGSRRSTGARSSKSVPEMTDSRIESVGQADRHSRAVR